MMEFTWVFWFWLGGLLFLFLPMELYAAVKTPGKSDTFSEFIWWAFGVKQRLDVPQVKWARFRRFVLAGMCVGLSTHFVLGWTVLPVILFGVPSGLIMLYAVLVERKQDGTR
jgi:hypothetical protein